MGNKMGNPAWVKGKSPNPNGRPRGQTSLSAYYRDPELFTTRHMRWERFCWALRQPPYTGAAAARKAPYSPKSARFIASRLRKKAVIRAILERHNAICYLYEKTGDMKYSLRGDVIKKRQELEELHEKIRQNQLKQKVI